MMPLWYNEVCFEVLYMCYLKTVGPTAALSLVIRALIVGLPYESLKVKLHFYVFCSWSVLRYLCVVGLKVGLHKLVN